MRLLDKILLSLVIIALASSCEEDTSNPIPPTGNMVLNLSDLEALPAGWIYEAWLVIGSETFSAGQFNTNAFTSDLKNKTIPVLSAKLEAADGFIITIESTTDGDPTPSVVKVLAGSFGQYEAQLSHDNTGAIGADLTNTANYSGSYLINTPTSVSTDDDTSGIWFIDNSGGSNTAGLSLPSLNAGWEYEGWLIIDGVPVSTGKFTNAAAADQSCKHCGPLTGPPFPGEDFLTDAPAGLSFPVSLAGRTAVISVEPQPDYDTDPYNIKILAAYIPAAGSIVIGQTYSMDAVDAVVPSGTVLRFFGFDCTGDGCN